VSETPKRIEFIKMQGLGNDFVLINSINPKTQSQRDITLSPEDARKICHRQFGIGCDQILWLKESDCAHAKMDILNADGSAAEMCGNGIRAAALFLAKDGPEPGQSEYKIETGAGVLSLRIDGAEGPELVEVNMGPPEFLKSFAEGEMIQAAGREFRFYDLSMGNPHAVIFVDEPVAEIPIESWGRPIETAARFPLRTNVEFVETIANDRIKIRVWERGSGATLACGTGACAAAVTAIFHKNLALKNRKLNVELPGGVLEIRWDGDGQPVFMKGPAKRVFAAEIDLSAVNLPVNLSSDQ